MSLPVAYSLDEVAQRLAPHASVVTVGVFDGVHRGHSRIIEEVIERKSRDQLKGAYLITFDPHPVLVTRSRKTPEILSTIEERLELFSRFPLDGVFVVRFDQDTARIHYREFIERYLLGAMDTRHLVLGYDHHFGYKREGSPERVREEGTQRGFGVSVVPPVEFESPRDIFEQVLLHEQKVTGLVNDLVDLAADERDHATEGYLQWFVNEQVEEMETANDTLSVLKLAGSDGAALLMIDKDLSTRVFNVPLDMAQQF